MKSKIYFYGNQAMLNVKNGAIPIEKEAANCIEELCKRIAELEERLRVEQSCNRCGQYHGREPCSDIAGLEAKVEERNNLIRLLSGMLKHAGTPSGLISAAADTYDYKKAEVLETAERLLANEPAPTTGRCGHCAQPYGSLNRIAELEVRERAYINDLNEKGRKVTELEARIDRVRAAIKLSPEYGSRTKFVEILNAALEDKT